jgi:ankyrin repeat protein
MNTLVELLVEDMGLVPEQAECIVDKMISFVENCGIGSALLAQLKLVGNGISPQNLFEFLKHLIPPPAHCDDLQILEQILDQPGVDPNISDSNGSTPLHYIAYWNRVDLAKLMIAHGATLNRQDQMGRSPLYIATCANSELLVTKLLIEQGAEPDIFTLSAIGDPDQISSLAKDHPELVNTREYYRHDAPLHKAVEFNNPDAVEVLLHLGADLTRKNLADEMPLHRAARYNRPEIANFLIAQGAPVNAKNRGGATPLDLAEVNVGIRAAVTDVLRNHGGRRDIEQRGIKWNTFTDELERYYAELECAIEFAMDDDGDGIKTFNVHPIGAKYFNKMIKEPGTPGWQDQALNEIQTIFFPLQDVLIREIHQGEDGDDNPELSLFVEILRST